MRTHILHGLLLLVCYHPPSPPAIDCAQALLAIPNVAVNVQVGVYNLYSSHSHLLTSYPGSLWKEEPSLGMRLFVFPRVFLISLFNFGTACAFIWARDIVGRALVYTTSAEKHVYTCKQTLIFLCHCRINLVIHHCTMQHGRDTQMLSQLS